MVEGFSFARWTRLLFFLLPYPCSPFINCHQWQAERLPEYTDSRGVQLCPLDTACDGVTSPSLQFSTSSSIPLPTLLPYRFHGGSSRRARGEQQRERSGVEWWNGSAQTHVPGAQADVLSQEQRATQPGKAGFFLLLPPLFQPSISLKVVTLVVSTRGGGVRSGDKLRRGQLLFSFYRPPHFVTLAVSKRREREERRRVSEQRRFYHKASLSANSTLIMKTETEARNQTKADGINPLFPFPSSSPFPLPSIASTRIQPKQDSIGQS